MAVQAINGANRAELHRLVDVALKSWPAKRARWITPKKNL
jgi:hypothetical protein